MKTETPALAGAKTIEILHRANVRPSVHRLAVLEYVANHRTHPTADEVFNAIARDFPTVSKTTVYNSLHTLVEAGIIRELEIESGSTRYDFSFQPVHSHFRCTRCGKIYDMGMPPGLDRMVASGFLVNTTDLFFGGLCPDCINYSENNINN